MRVAGYTYVAAFVLCFHLTLSPAAAIEPDLIGAWAHDRAECQELFSRSGKATIFRTPVSAFAQAFIIEGRRLTTPNASCRIKGVKRFDDRRILALSCTTSVASSDIPAIFAPAADGSLHRYTNQADTHGTRYERCSP